MKKQKHILVVRSGYPYKEFILKKLKELNYFVIVLDSTKNCPKGLVDDWILADLNNEKECVAAVNAYLAKRNKRIDGAVTFWEEAVLVTAKIAEKLGLPGISYRTAATIKNKFSFREFCELYGLPTPRHALLQADTNFDEIVKNLSFPLVIKPIYGAASAFVMKADSLRGLKKAYLSINRYIESFWLRPEWKSIDLFVEEYIDGQEVDIDMLIQDGQLKFYSISDNFQTHEPFFIETGQTIPSRLARTQQDELIEMAMRVVTLAGIKDACIHFEAKSSSNGPVPIEVNLRMGGDEVHSFIKEAWNVDFVEQAAKIAIGEKIEITKPLKPFSYLEGRYFLPTQGGVIKQISIPQSVINNKNIFDIKISKTVGDAILPPPQDFDYFGWITVRGKTAIEVHNALTKLYPKIEFHLESYEQPNLQTHF